MSYQLNQTKFLSKAELDILNHELSKNLDKDERNVTLIELALKTGARASELLNLTQSSLSQENSTVLILGLKNSRDREIPIPSELFKRVLTHVPFKISYPRLVQIWNLYKPSQKSFHSLRHTVALSLYVKHRDLRLVQMVLGHRNIQNTMIYADYHFSMNELRRLL